VSDADFDNRNAGAGGGRPGTPGGGEPLDDLIGAYLLDALDEEERVAFEAFLLESEAARHEAAQLRPVVDLLPLALDLPASDPLAGRVVPSAGLRGRILDAVRAESAAAPVNEAPAPAVAPPPPLPAPTRPTRPEPTPIRPPGRILPAGRPGDGRLGGGIATFGWSQLAAAILALIALAALIWALTLQGRIGDLEDENDDLQSTIVAGNQTLAYILRPTADGPLTAAGVLFPRENGQTAQLDMLGMAPLPDGQVYQLWFVDLDEAGNPAGVTPSVTLGVDDQGHGAVADVPLPEGPFDAVAVTVEPVGGSVSPTTPIQMFGTTGTVAG
jgi:hypothetical protein